MMPDAIGAEKKRLRQQLILERDRIAPAQKEAWDTQIAQQVLGLPEYQSAKTVLLYLATAREISTRRLIQDCRENGKVVASPRCVTDGHRMDFYAIPDDSDLMPGSYGILEPDPARCRRITDLTQSVCILPALAADRDGNRLGYGGGYYDRYLSNYTYSKILLIYRFGLLEHLSVGPHDVPADLIVTPDTVIRATKQSKPT